MLQTAEEYPFLLAKKLQYGEAVTTEATKPFYTSTDFQHKYTYRYQRWEVVVVSGRWWCTDIRKQYIRPPVAMAVLGCLCSENSNSSNDNTNKVLHRHLVYCTVLEDNQPASVAEELTAVLQATPQPLRPAHIILRVYSQAWQLEYPMAYEAARKDRNNKGTECLVIPITVINEFRDKEKHIITLVNAGQQKWRTTIVAVSETATSTTAAEPFDITFTSWLHGIITATDSTDPYGFRDLDKYFVWMSRVRNMFPDVSTKGLIKTAATETTTITMTNAAAELVELAVKHPCLSTMRMRHPPTTVSAPAPPGPVEDRDPEEEERERRRKTVSVVVFTVPTPPGQEALKYPHVVAVQRPYYPVPENKQNSKITDNPMEDDAISSGGGPPQPQAIGLELHLHASVGDALFIFNTLSKPHNVEMYEDLLHPDGEVFVQMGPAEGANFDDVLHSIEAFQAHGMPLGFAVESKDASTESNKKRLVPVADGARYRNSFAVPRCVFNAPTGTAERRTPVEATRMTLESSSPNEEMLRSAVAAVKYFTSELVVEEKSGEKQNISVLAHYGGYHTTTYGIHWDKAKVVIPEGVKLLPCSYCGRTRDTLSRCSACKSALYCRSSHQALDWKGNHKKECVMLKEAMNVQYPALEDEMCAAGNIPVTERTSEEESKKACALSNARTFLSLLEKCMAWYEEDKTNKDTTPQQPLVVHLLHVQDPDLFLVALATCAKQKTLHRQVRILLVNSTVSMKDQNSCMILKKSTGAFVPLPPTGVLGDVWHCAVEEGNSSSKNEHVTAVEVTEAPFIVRLYHEKYHHFTHNATSTAFKNTVGATAASSCNSLHADVLLSIGGTSYEGLTYFHAATEVMADHCLGKIPVAIAEPHFLTCHRTLSALASRVSMGGKGKNSVQYAPGSAVVMRNGAGACPIPLPAGTSVTPSSSSGVTVAPSHLPLYLNSFIALLLPKYL